MQVASRLPDVLHIGFPKSASTYLLNYLRAHPDTFIDRKAKSWATIGEVPERTAEELAGLKNARLYVTCGEKVSEARRMQPGTKWRELRFDTAATPRIDDYLEFSPAYYAAQLKQAAPDAKVLLCIREQVDWLISAYRFYIEQLPAGLHGLSSVTCSTKSAMADTSSRSNAGTGSAAGSPFVDTATMWGSDPASLG